MTFDLKLQALAGSSLNDIPELTNREFSAIANAKAGRSVIFLSDLSKQEAVAVSGIPGISDLPGFQGATDETKTRQTTSLLIIITPEIVRHDHTELAGPAILLPAHD
jgi:type II secretory pathway component GspD/PulD (secretin)